MVLVHGGFVDGSGWPAQRAMSQRAGSKVTEVAACHSVFLSQPATVAALIEQGASG